MKKIFLVTGIIVTLILSFIIVNNIKNVDKTSQPKLEEIMTQNNHKELIEKLKNPEAANAYFEAVLKECKNYDDETSKQRILEALKNISEAQPDAAHLDLSQDGFTVSAALRVLNFVSKNLI